MPDLPGMHALVAMALTLVSLILFSRDSWRLELTSLAMLCVLALFFSVFPIESIEPVEFFFGFGHEALVAVCALMIVGQGLVQTGALEPVGRALGNLWGQAPFLSLFATLFVAAVLSAFMNNTPIVVLLLPILISVALRTGSSATAVLMPMGFATLLGGMATTIGTSTNLLVVSVAADMGLPRIGMFDFFLPAAMAGCVGILYLWLIAPRLLPEHASSLPDTAPRLFSARLALTDTSPAVGLTLSQAQTLAGGMRVVRIRRGETFVHPLPDVTLRAGDRLRVRDTPTRLKAFEDALKADLYSGEHRVDEEHPLKAPNQTLAEVAVVPGAVLDNANLRFVQFIDRYQLAVLAIHRGSQDIWSPSEELHDVILQAGDVLLVQGAEDQIARLKSNTEFLVLDGAVELPRTAKAPLALAIIAAVVLPAALGWIPIAVTALCGAAAMVLTRCLTFEAALKAVSPSVVFIVVVSLALGDALVKTGATSYLTELFVVITQGASHAVLLSALMALLAVLTNVVSNNAAAVIGTPIAVGIAEQLGLPPQPFVLAVLFGANLSYATPMAYKTNLLVMSAGNYRFAEFVRVGVPLTVLMWLTLSWLLATLYF